MADDRLSVIVIQLDSLNRHFLSAYGNDWVRTPNLARFAERAVVFEQHYTGSLPCMPARREIWAGVEEFWWRGWGPLEPWDRPLAFLAGQRGIVSQLITDHYHFFEWGAHSYAYDFTGYEFIRGHEHDNWVTEPLAEVPPWARRMVEVHGEGGLTYLRNVAHFRGEEDFFGPRVMAATAEWLGRNHAHERFYLHVDCFDVHEPFHVPEPYRSMYTGLPPEGRNPWPRYGRTDDPAMGLTPEDVAWVRAQFAGKLTMVDAWLGRVLDALERHRLWERTCVMVTTDHGHYLGEHDRIGKPGSPLWHTLCHIPLLVWHPGARAGRVSAVTQTVDLYATVLELLGLEAPEGSHSHSFVPVLEGKDRHRGFAVYGYNNQRVGLSTPEWTLLRDQDPAAAPAYVYSHQVGQLNQRSAGARHRRDFELLGLEAGRFLPGVSTPVWRMPSGAWDVLNLHPPRPDLLYHNPSDPEQERNLAADRPAKVAELEALLRGHMRRLGVPEEQYARLRL